MNLGHALFWGFAATTVLSVVVSVCKGLGFTRMEFPYMLGTLVTPNRDRAKWIGVLIHFVNGWIFSLVYVGAFVTTGIYGWWAGALIGLVHALFVLTVGMSLLPGIHPRMASEQFGPDPTRQLEPPGFLALHYGAGTPVVSIVAHIIYGAVLGGFYR